MAEPQLVFLRDLADVEPPRDRYAHYDEEDIYRLVPRPQWTGLEDEIWTPRSQEHDPQLEKVKALMKRNSDGAGDMSPSANAFSATKFATKLARKKRKNPRVKVRMFLNNKYVEGLVNLLILWSLFMEDIRVLNFPKEWDVTIWCVHIFVMFAFFLEIVLRSYSQRGFFGSFYFVLDTGATVSIIMDFQPLLVSSAVNDEGATDNLRAAKSARVGTRIARLVRVIRVIRVIKLFVSARGLKKQTKDDKDGEAEDEGAPSELSKALQGTIAKKTIIFVLCLLGGSVTIEFPNYSNVHVAFLGDDRARLGMAQLWASVSTQYLTGGNVSVDPFLTMRQKFRTIMESPQQTDSIWTFVTSPLYRIDVKNYGPDNLNFTFWPVPGMIPPGTSSNAYGVVETTEYFLAPSKYSTLVEEPGMPGWVPSWPEIDNYWPNCELADLDVAEQMKGLGHPADCPNARGPRRSMRELRVKGPAEIARLPFVIDKRLADRLGIPELNSPEPVFEIWYGTKYKEDVQSGMSLMMIICITIILGGMGYLLSRDVDQMVIKPIENMVDSVTKLAANPAYQMEPVTKVVYETDALKMSLSKIATMLQVGFGEAGNNLVAENLKRGDTVDPMVPGTKLLGAYGFCIIDEYEEVLECLGEDILPFTNVAASIVHDAVTENGGQPNRNLGEAFLCVWKPETGLDEVAPEVLERAETKMCDGALTAFRRCVRGIAMSGPLQAYNQHDEIVKFFDGNYTTRIGYGLHYGWAIEGAVGTNIKIDCSYLSPNVNLAARLESATKMYGVNVLMSESFQSKLSPQTKKGLRRVDVVCLKGSSIPMAIYTCDRSNALWVAQKAIDTYGPDKVIDEFQRLFEEGMDEFVSGNWQGSKTFFEQALAICPRDKPSQRILMHMDTPENHPDYGLATNPFVAPEGWPGYHILLSK
jgi:class 3 adenylate cyclase